ncbi:hypothetical protein [Azospirillum thermophilum]|uniref:Uncharacterized protein n=1 Tax=Azospirillum thermophilum TaxID=2202148 RepID=A0A2S2D132_9PROT|nr:hypothetical protein [Azospirillum thermophilum]AWK90167.1 hypothetical protein DEW08_29580 [Azospirillum thermophilum]
MQTTKHPYEFLVRWDRGGNLAGAHAQFRYVTRSDDGAIVGDFIGPAEPVGVAGADGFPLADLLSEVQASALAALEAARAERDAALARAAG